VPHAPYHLCAIMQRLYPAMTAAAVLVGLGVLLVFQF
jgi:hypothetical protein